MKDFFGDVLKFAIFAGIAIIVFVIIIFIMLFPFIVNIPWLLIFTSPLAWGLAVAITERL